MGYDREDVGYLHQHSVEDVVEEQDSPEEFLDQEAWPVVRSFLSDLGMDLDESYTIRLQDEVTGSTDFAGSAGDIADSVDSEKAIRLKSSTDMRLLPLMVHEGVHKYHSELKDAARDIGTDYKVFRGLGGFVEKMDVGNGVDFQYSSLAHQRPERLNLIGQIADEELEKWRNKRKEKEEELEREYSERFSELDLSFRSISRGSDLNEGIKEYVTEEYGEDKCEEIENWVSENAEEYIELRKKESEASNLATKAVRREMELEGIDQGDYGSPSYDEGFTMAATLFASAGLDEDYWMNYLDSDHEYAEEPMNEIIKTIYNQASEAEGVPMEKMREGMKLQDRNYIEGKKLV